MYTPEREESFQQTASNFILSSFVFALGEGCHGKPFKIRIAAEVKSEIQ